MPLPRQFAQLNLKLLKIFLLDNLTLMWYNSIKERRKTPQTGKELIDMNEKKMDEVVADFRAQWSEDFRRAMEREPDGYTLWMGEEVVVIPNTGKYERRFVVEITNWNNDDTGTAICNPSDKVDVLLGQAIAWARLNNIPLPKQLKSNRITIFKKLKVGKIYSQLNSDIPFTVISKSKFHDDLLYTICYTEIKTYDVLSCKTYDAITMNKKFNIC